ncbi:GIY-YIG nuclease family protein [Candidatus Microgenomates bacterium]|jgi:putative endonuclease|nr:MAG: GIY-YIG nuclease family protein [Candidatus Microgenomates bacterium]
MYFVYILRSTKDGKYYIGSTKNIEQRLYRHNRGLVKSTTRRAPLKLIYYEEYKTLSEALKRESKIKSYKGGEAFKRLLKNSRW